MKQTSIDWLVKEIESFGIDTKFISESINKAKEMNKQEIIQSFKEGTRITDIDDELSAEFNGVVYFYETFD
jgi:hypothetical protein